MKYIYNLAFKMSVSAMIALFLGNLLGLKFATVGAVIAILSIQDTRLKAIVVGKNRMLAIIIGQALSLTLYLLLGQNVLSFGLFLIIFIPLTSRFKIEEGMIAAVVLSTHLLVADTITVAWVINELGLMLIGVGTASIANIFMPALEDTFNEDKLYIEEKYRVIFSKMAKSLITQTVDIDEQKIIDDVENRLEQSRNVVDKIVSNNFYKSSSYYIDYINMRKTQFEVIKRMRRTFDRFNMSVGQMKIMSEFTNDVAENIREDNDCKVLLDGLIELKIQYKKMDLPKTREEFENRAQLLQFLNELEEFLTIKRDYVNSLDNK